MDTYLEALSAEERNMERNQDRTAVPGLYVTSGNRGIYDPSARASRSTAILGAVVVLVLLIVCANVANLLLSRATSRQKEISVRMSMGATRRRLVQQLLTEGVLLSVIGGILGLMVAYRGRGLLPQGQTTSLDWRVFSFVALLSVATGIIFSLIPALRATRLDVASSLKENSRSVSGSKTRLSKALLVQQVAVSLVLLIGAGLFLNTLQNLREVDVGFNPDNVLLFRVDPRLNGYEDDRMAALYEQMRETLGTIPGVRSVSLTRTAFLSGSTSTNRVYAQGRETMEGNSISAHMMTVSPEFFGTLELPLLAGRMFDNRDGQDASKVAIINDAAAKHFFSGDNPLGLRFGFQREDDGDIEVVGIVRDVKYSNVRDPEPPTVYLPYLQRTFGSMIFELKTASDPQVMIPTVRETVRGIEPNMPLMNVSTQSEQIEQRLAQARFFAMSYSLFGGLAVLVASIGLFGLASHNVVRRTNEIGIRMALGAQRWDVTRMVLSESLILVVIGIGIGLATAWAAGRLITSLLFGLAPTDGITVIAATGVIILVSALAGYLPARRASRVDPMVALQYE
jgi:predicted permease